MKRVIWGALLLFVLAGCGGYWQIVDPVSKNVYYTQKVKKIKGRTVQFIDANTGHEIILKNFEVKEITQDEFKANVKAE